MGVLKELVDNNEAHFADSGGFVSPSGLAYIGETLISLKIASGVTHKFSGFITTWQMHDLAQVKRSCKSNFALQASQRSA